MSRLRTIRASRDAGMASAEYAMATVAACGFGGALIKLLTSQPIVSLLMKTLTRAFDFSF